MRYSSERSSIERISPEGLPQPMQSSYFAMIVGAILVNNFVLARFLGICPFLGVSKKLATALGMSGAVLFVMTMASAVTAALYRYVLVPQQLTYLRTIVFILVIASLVQLVEVALQKFSASLYRALGIYLPLITTNCAVLGAAVIASGKDYGILRSTVFGAASAVGFALALVLFASLREKLELAQVPECFRGTAIALVTAGILAMVFMGFKGLGA